MYFERKLAKPTSFDSVDDVEIIHGHLPEAGEDLFVGETRLHWAIVASLAAVVEGVGEERRFDAHSRGTRTVVLELFMDEGLADKFD